MSEITEGTVAEVLNLFSSPKFETDGKYKNIVIPEFQRPYCWELSDIQKLLNDVDALRFRGEQQENGGLDLDCKDFFGVPYYFGTVSFRCDKENLELLDGQQRITSLLIVTKVLYERTKQETDPELQKFPIWLITYLEADGVIGSLSDNRKQYDTFGSFIGQLIANMSG